MNAKLLADRAAAAALAGPTVPAGQWVYQRTVTYQAGPPKGLPARLTQDSWSLYSKLGSLPANPRALDRYLAKLSHPNANATQANNDVAAFSTIEQLLSGAVLPPSLNAELYRAPAGQQVPLHRASLNRDLVACAALI